MKNFVYFGEKFGCFYQSFRGLMAYLLRVLVFQVNPFWIQLTYFITVSLVGFLALKFSKPRTDSFRPKDLDLFFMSVSATTVTSLSTVEMEVFSNTQLVFLTILMLFGGEVFTSMLGLQLVRSKFMKHETVENSVDLVNIHRSSSNPMHFIHQSELGLNTRSYLEKEKSNTDEENGIKSMGFENNKYNSIKSLGYVVLGYFLIVHVFGSILVLMYVRFISSAREVLKSKGLQSLTFSVFTTVSTFSNCGFIPTNENMIVFKKNSGLLLLLIPQILLGNTLYPPCLRFVIWVLEKITKREEYNYMLKSWREIGYGHLLSSLHSSLLVVTAFGFILVQFILFFSMERNSEAMDGLDSYQKLVASLFETVNTRHTGESVVDLSIISPAILVLFVVMMYLPPYTSFLPIMDHKKVSRNDQKSEKQRKKLVENLLFSQLSYLAIFIILICITEREKMKDDPLNFNVLNIMVEVISAYGNVGFSTGYSCKRQLKPDSYCKDKWYGFAGRWSNKGKTILIIVLFFGRVKKFNMKGGRAWKLF